MVDVAFLLLIFFMVTTVFRRPLAMEVNIPEPGAKVEVPASNVMTVYITQDGAIVYDVGQRGLTEASWDELRDILVLELDYNPELIVLVKVDRNARYERMVDVLDALDEARMHAIQRHTDDGGGQGPDRSATVKAFSLVNAAHLPLTGELHPLRREFARWLSSGNAFSLLDRLCHLRLAGTCGRTGRSKRKPCRRASRSSSSPSWACLLRSRDRQQQAAQLNVAGRGRRADDRYPRAGARRAGADNRPSRRSPKCRTLSRRSPRAS